MSTLGIRAVIALTIAAFVLVGVGVLLGEYFETPEEASLREPPVVVPVTDPLRAEVLEDRLTLRGMLTPARRGIPRFAAGIQERVISAVPVEPGVELQPGQVLVEVEGRPVIVLSGEFPAWRDFTQSIRGPDVLQLQSALKELGLYTQEDRVPGTVGHRTLNAVLALYQSLGYEPPAWAQVPHQELVFLPSGLRIVERVTVITGDRLKPDAILLASAARRIEVELTVDQRRVLVPGLQIRVAGSSVSESWTGTIERLLDLPSPDSAASQAAAIMTTEPIPDWMTGEQVFEVVLASTREPVLTAASSAVHTTADGMAFVVVLEGDEETAIPVAIGVVTATRIEITPAAPHALGPGDELVLNVDR
jgi:hypothetical protein